MSTVLKHQGAFNNDMCTFKMLGFFLLFLHKQIWFWHVDEQEGLDDASFENYKSGLVAKLLEKDPSLQYETNRLWNQITDKRYVFDSSLKEAEKLETIHKSDVINWFRTYLQQSSPKCRRLTIRLWGCNIDLKEVETRADSEQVITDITAFKVSSEYYPSLCWICEKIQFMQ